VPLAGPPDKPITLRALIADIVGEQVRQFEDRQQQRQFLRVLTEREIAEGAQRGKIESGGTDVPLQPVDIAEAIETALQAFQDGLYLVAIDDETVESLDQELSLAVESHITFIRLTLLAGG